MTSTIILIFCTQKRHRWLDEIYVYYISLNRKHVIEVHFNFFIYFFLAELAHFCHLIIQLDIHQALRVVKSQLVFDLIDVWQLFRRLLSTIFFQHEISAFLVTLEMLSMILMTQGGVFSMASSLLSQLL